MSKTVHEKILDVQRLQQHGAFFAEAVAAELTAVSVFPSEHAIHPLHQPRVGRGGVGVMEGRGGSCAVWVEMSSVARGIHIEFPMLLPRAAWPSLSLLHQPWWPLSESGWCPSPKRRCPR